MGDFLSFWPQYCRFFSKFTEFSARSCSSGRNMELKLPGFDPFIHQPSPFLIKLCIRTWKHGFQAPKAWMLCVTSTTFLQKKETWLVESKIGLIFWARYHHRCFPFVEVFVVSETTHTLPNSSKHEFLPTAHWVLHELRFVPCWRKRVKESHQKIVAALMSLNNPAGLLAVFHRFFFCSWWFCNKSA